MSDSAFRVNRGLTLNPQVSAPANPTNGDIYYDSTRNSFVQYNNGFWQDAASKSDIASAADLTSAQLTASVVQSSMVKLTGSTSGNIHGLAASSGAKQVLLYNGSTAAMVVKYQSVTEGTAANRITTYNAGDINLLAGQSAIFIYDVTASTWILATVSGTGGGSGTGSDLGTLQFRAQFLETFTENAANAASAVNAAAGFTNGAYNASKQIYTLNYDASKTITTTGTAATISTAPGFTVAVGDIVVLMPTNEVKKITTVTDQTTYVLESAFVTDAAGAAVCISQAVHTKDIYNYAGTGAAISAAFGATTFSEIMVDYEDNSTTNSNLWTPNVAPFVGFSASTDNTNWSALGVRATNETDIMQSVICPTAGTSLYIRFFADKTSGSGIVNLIQYEAFMQKNLTTGNNSNVIWSAYGVTNSSTTPINCTISVVGGKTTITFPSNSYPVGVLSGQTIGALSVQVNGQELPRYVAGSVPATDGFYTEYSANSIQLDKDYSALALDFQIAYNLQVLDVSTTNTTAIANLQMITQQGFQNFVDSNTYQLTAVNGTPSSTQFRSSISNRASISDLSQDLKPRMGIERIMTQACTQLQNEFGPNGEPVFATQNDDKGLIRFVGGWASPTGTYGSCIQATTITDYVEIIFYGTGLNVLVSTDVTTRDARASVDGGAEGTNIYGTGTLSNILGGRNYAQNTILSVSSGLALGIHTIKIRVNSIATSGSIFFGFEILNESASIKTQPGISYVNGSKLVNTAQSTFAYNSIATGIRGGRVLVYQQADGTIGKSWQAVDAAAAYLTSADHTNEEVSRIYNWREFGVGRADDFSLITSAITNSAFTLDDGITTLVGYQIASPIFNNMGIAANSGFATITFIGTGLDIMQQDSGNGGADTYNIQVDGGSTQALATAGSAILRKTKIVSGLPYGTHTVKFNRVTAATWNFGIQQFIVYQPKTPAVPSGALQVGSYNVMANYVAASSAAIGFIGSGILRKMVAVRETIFTGTWVDSGVAPTVFENGHSISCSNGATASYTFFGTGFELKAYTGTGANNVTVSVDGSTNLSGFTTSLQQTSSGATFTAATGNFGGTNAGNTNFAVQVSGLTLGKHSVLITQNNTNGIYIDTMDIITPIHSPKSNLNADLQNTLSVGSNSISDDRNLSPVANLLPQNKNWAQAFGVTSAPTTTSTVPVPVPDMSVTIKTSGGRLRISFSNNVSSNGAGIIPNTQAYVDGIAVGRAVDNQEANANYTKESSDVVLVPVSAGYHKVDLYWALNAGGTGQSHGRTLLVEEV